MAATGQPVVGSTVTAVPLPYWQSKTQDERQSRCTGGRSLLAICEEYLDTVVDDPPQWFDAAPINSRCGLLVVLSIVHTRRPEDPTPTGSRLNSIIRRVPRGRTRRYRVPNWHSIVELGPN